MATRRSGATALATDAKPLVLRVQLVNAANASYEGHVLLADFTRLQSVPDDKGQPVALPVPATMSLPLPRDGLAELMLPPQEELGEALRLRVLAPDGRLRHDSTRPTRPLPEALKLEVEPAQFAATAPNTDPAAGKPARLRGRVIDRAGRAQVARRQVVVWAADAVEPQAADFRALIVATTDASGYFSGPYPLGAFTSAHGDVSLGDGDPVSVPIHLADGGVFEEQVILVVDLDEAHAHEDGDAGCGCGTGGDAPRDPDTSELGRADGTFSSDPGAGRCVDFTKPDRTLEEFDFSYVVRTTEPMIRGLTLTEPAKFDLSRFTHLLPRATVLQNTLERAAALPAALTFATPQVDASVLRSLAADPDGFTIEKVQLAAELTLHGDFLRAVGQHLTTPPGRTALDCDNPVDWDRDPTIYQACTIAHGHLLRFKQEWVADGYSMGNLLYSLPLAPGQKKQIAVVDWERREVASRTETLEEQETLSAAISRDRDLNEIVTGTLTESTRGGSSASSSSIAGGLGVGAILGPVGGLLGVGGGSSSASSSAFQNSSRNTAASALNQLRDRTIQSASALRSQRSTVVQALRQGERAVASTESVANYNHCHAITIQYFEVLRHLLVRQRLVDVQECLFVPLLMSRFDSDKALRWKNTLRPAVPGRLNEGFYALERIKNQYAGSDFPVGSYADQSLESLDGFLYLRFEIARPADAASDAFDPNAWLFLSRLFPVISAADFHRQYLASQAAKDRVFQEQMAPRIAERFVQHLRFFAIDANETRSTLPVDTTLVSDFSPDRPLYVTLRLNGALPTLARKSIRSIEISDVSSLLGIPLLQLLPANSKVIVTTGTLNYRTRFSSDSLFRNANVMNDLVGGDVVRIDCPLKREELRNPREEDKEISRLLLAHLNEHLEPFHHHMWRRMSDARRYMLLDGFEAPNAGGRSVASVVQNELVGIVGNCLVLPVAPGFHLDPTFRQDVENPVDLLEHYQPNTPIEPSRIAIPTRGVYAEAVMGACNACERKEEERFWRWEESPLPDQPPQILPVSTDSRATAAPDLTAKDFPTPIVNIQNAPAAPDPTGLGAALQLLGTPNVFKDITGLEGTQKNAAAALQQAFGTAQFFGGKAADLALQAKMSRDIDKAVKTIGQAKQSGLITPEQAQQLTQSAIGGMIGAGAEPKAKPLTTAEEVAKIAGSAGANKADISVKRADGEIVEAKTLPQAVGAPSLANAQAQAEADLGVNTASQRSFAPDAADKTGRTRLRATVSNAPPGATFRWVAPAGDRIRFDPPTAGETEAVAGAPGVTSVTFEVHDTGGNLLRTAHTFLSVPRFFAVDEYTGAAYTSHRPAAANSHRFDSVLAQFRLTAQKNDVLTTAKLVAEFLLRAANVRLVWQMAPFGEVLPAQFQAGGFARRFLVPIDIAGFAPTTRFGANRVAGTVGLTNFQQGSTFVPTTGVIEVYPGGLDSGVFPQVQPMLARLTQLETQVAADPGNAALAQQLDLLRDTWVEIVGRLMGVSIAHEVHHMLLGEAPGIGRDGHTVLPEIDLLSAGSSLSFKQWTGIETATPLPAAFPDTGTFVDRGFDGLVVIGEANQGRIDALFPVPPAFPFG